ncbi:MAG: globin [Moraxellaceae bacterium]|nr:MAG: globin [Moraxellaceae bacterium]
MAPTQETPQYGVKDASFQAAGQEPGVRKLVDAFYDEMEVLPEAKLIRDMHPEDLEESRDKLARFLCGWLGGPKLFQAKYGKIRIPLAHRHLAIGLSERDAWLLCMEHALQKQDFNPLFKKYLLEQLFVPAEGSRNQE